MNPRVHLIFSDGKGKVPLEDRYQVYGIALTPFALNIPVENVDFTVNPVLVLDPDAVFRSANEMAAIRDNEEQFFPTGYHEYFRQVCRRASGVQAIWNAPSCGIRIITGHGLPRNKCGVLVCQGKEILFQELGDHVASILTVLDFSNTPFAVAALAGHYRNSDPGTDITEPRKKWGRKLNRRHEFVARCQTAFACDNMNMTWAFRVAELSVPHPPEDFAGMSKPFGDAVVFSVLGAIHEWHIGGRVGDLDGFFSSQFHSIHSNFIDEPRSPESRLTNLQVSIESGELTINPNTFNCKLFENSHRWYFTTERLPTAASNVDDKAAGQAQIDFVVDSLRVWHTANPNQDCEYPQAVHAWRVLGNLFGNPLKTIELEFDEETGELKRVDDGISISVWAQSCKDLPGILKQVQNLQASGSLFDNGVSDSE
jgi:hypothetical protein